MRKLCTLVPASLLVLGWMGVAMADFTGPFGSDYTTGDNVEDRLDYLYGLGNLTRIDDYNAAVTDQLWHNVNGVVTAKAKYAGHEHDFYAGDFLLFNTGGSYFGYLTGPSVPFTPSDSGNPFAFRLYDYNDDVWWSSVQGDNNLGRDHMVTWKITADVGHPDNVVGNYVIGWEDLDLGDKDYGDLIVEVSQAHPAAVPEATTLMLFGSGLSGLLFFARKKRLIKF